MVVKLAYKELVIGHTVAAQLYAFLNNAPIVMAINERPELFEYLDPDVDTSIFSLPRQTNTLNTPSGSVIFGNSKQQAWDHLMFINSMAGLVPLADKVSSLRLVDDRTLKVVTSGRAVVEIHFDKLVVFNHANLKGLPEPVSKEEKFLVVDWVNVSSTKHSLDMIETSEDFVNKLVFYPSKRIMGNHTDKKDLALISNLTKEQLYDYQYSDTYARFKALDIMGDLGIRGPRNGKSTSNPDEYTHYRLKLEVTARDVLDRRVHYYEDQSTIFFNYQTEKDIIRDGQTSEKTYVRKLNRILTNGKSLTK